MQGSQIVIYSDDGVTFDIDLDAASPSLFIHHKDNGYVRQFLLPEQLQQLRLEVLAKVPDPERATERRNEAALEAAQ